MLALYLGALVVALGVIGVQAFAGHDADASGHDASHGGHDAPSWALLLSLRFWSFASLAFGLSGTLLVLFGLSGPALSLAISSVVGLAAGLFASAVIRRMTHKGPTSQVLPSDVVGKIGRVLVPSDGGARGKVRVELRGQIVDYVASSRESLAADEVVVIEEFDGKEVSVSKAPRELKP